MLPIHIPVTREEAHVSPQTLFRILSGGFVLGLLVGTFSLQPSLFTNPARFIAGVGDVNISTKNDVTDTPAPREAVKTQLSNETILPTNTPNDVSLGEVTGVADVTAPTDVSPTPLVTPPDPADIRDENITRLTREIARIKNASVALIAEFNQNCGAWADECATPYATQLEKNNIAYEHVAEELNAISY